jgi:hypothetical protein
MANVNPMLIIIRYLSTFIINYTNNCKLNSVLHIILKFHIYKIYEQIAAYKLLRLYGRG